MVCAEVAMTYIDDPKIIVWAEAWFINQYGHEWLVDYQQISDDFVCWLRSQGCEIERSEQKWLCDSLGIAQGYDRFRFDNDQDALLFTLRWS